MKIGTELSTLSMEHSIIPQVHRKSPLRGQAES